MLAGVCQSRVPRIAGWPRTSVIPALIRTVDLLVNSSSLQRSYIVFSNHRICRQILTSTINRQERERIEEMHCYRLLRSWHLCTSYTTQSCLSFSWFFKARCDNTACCFLLLVLDVSGVTVDVSLQSIL